MGKVVSIGGGKRFAVGATFRGVAKGRYGYGQTFAQRQAAEYEANVGFAARNFADGTLGAAQFAYVSKGNKAAREAAVMALAQVKVNYGQLEVAA